MHSEGALIKRPEARNSTPVVTLLRCLSNLDSKRAEIAYGVLEARKGLEGNQTPRKVNEHGVAVGVL